MKQVYHRIKTLYPDAIVGLNFSIVDHKDGNEEQIEMWNYKDLPQPTAEELEAIDPAATKRTTEALSLRKENYPDIKDQIGAIVKQIAALDVLLLPEMQGIVDKVNATKLKYPKSIGTRDENTISK